MTRINSILVANRGEIAVRVMRTAKAMGLRTIAVYSDADAHALHVRSADTALRIGPASVAESYLNADAVLAAALASGADAIHPGYGFLSENQAFAAACKQAGLCFIGPPNEAIDVMGDKARAKRAMLAAGVPCVPGYQGEDQTLATLIAAAEEIGVPVMVKAAAGGGGRGMRLVDDLTQLPRAIELAQSEALNAFGSSELIIEKAVLRPRHVEVQVFADQYGNVVHLGERDCSVQRRHQKVIEESPCPIMTPSLRAAMGAAAVEAARAVQYEGAGTVEFLLDEQGEFYFLEMNTRLQVEHPVTEYVTGFDLVEWQIRVARGEPLPVDQTAIGLNGHAIEVRLYAEDPAAGFLPSTGRVSLFSTPQREGLRVDSGVESGDEVSPFYDAMVAKIIAYGTTREDARLRLTSALSDTALLGPKSNRDFLIDALNRAVFIEGAATTDFIAAHYGDRYSPEAVAPRHLIAAAAIQHRLEQAHWHSQSLGVCDDLLDWSSVPDHTVTREYCLDETPVRVMLTGLSREHYRVECAGQLFDVVLRQLAHEEAYLLIDGEQSVYRFHAEDAATLHLSSADRTFTVVNQLALPPASEEIAGGGSVVAPMHGQLLDVSVAVGQSVAKGDRIAVLEAMKMQHELIAPLAGVVATVAAHAGQQLAAGDLILAIEATDE